MEVRPTALPEVLEIVPKRHGDERGFFSEVYNQATFRQHGIDLIWVQDNHALSRQPGVLRGLHYQVDPMAQDKLVRVTRGRIFDVAVDARKGSPRYGKWVGVELSAERWNQLLVPQGFLHGYLTLDPDTEVLYKVTALYSPAHDRAVRYDDPDIGIAWPSSVDLTLSDRDGNAPRLREAENSFAYEATR